MKVLSVVVLLVAGAAAASGAASSEIPIIDLGTLGGDFSSARALNGNDRVVGQSHDSAARIFAFSWTAATGMINLGTLGGMSPPFSVTSEAVAVNDAGQVVGNSLTADGQVHAFFWTPAGGLADLGTLGGDSSQAFAVNSSGQVIGEAQTGTAEFHAFSWTATGGMEDLGPVVAWGVNDNGEVIAGTVGLNAVGRPSDSVFSWTKAGGLVDLGPLGGFGGSYTIATAVNTSGQVVGYGATATDEEHAFLWSASGGLIDLGVIGGTRSHALGLNGVGQVVGDNEFVPETVVAPAIIRGILWSEAGGAIDLGSLGGTAPLPSQVVSRALGVNDRGEVMGLGLLADNATSHAFLWTDTRGLMDLGSLGGSSAPVAINARGSVAGVSDTPGGGRRAVLWPAASNPTDIISSLITAAADAGFRQASQLLRSALRSAGRGEAATACKQISAFASQVRAQSGKRLTASQANELLMLANDSRSALGCQRP